MRYWPTLLMVIVLAGLGGYLYWVELPTKTREEKQEHEEKQLLSLPESTISGMTVGTAQEPVELKRMGTGEWTITAPLQTAADPREVQSLLRALVTGAVTRTIENGDASLASFGLDPPITTITVSSATEQETLSIGERGPLSNTLYVFRASDRKVLLTNLSPQDFVNKTLMTFRRKELLKFVQNDIDRVRLTHPTTEIVISNTALGEPKPFWKISYPIEAEADQIEVRSFLFRLEDLKALAIIDPGPERDAIEKTLTAPKLKVTLYTTAGEQTVRLYQPDPQSGEAIAETTAEAPLYRVNPMTIKDLGKDLFALQDKRLLGADTSDIAILSLQTRDQQYTLINQNGEWVLQDRSTEKLNQDKVNLLVSRIANLPAEERVIKQSVPLAPYGLLAPTAEFVATGRDGKIVGKLTLGNQVGNLAYATGQRLQGIFQVRPDLLTQIPSKTDLFDASKDNEDNGRP